MDNDKEMFNDPNDHKLIDKKMISLFHKEFGDHGCLLDESMVVCDNEVRNRLRSIGRLKRMNMKVTKGCVSIQVVKGGKFYDYKHNDRLPDFNKAKNYAVECFKRDENKGN